jgi:hypothetical protein
VSVWQKISLQELRDSDPQSRNVDYLGSLKDGCFRFRKLKEYTGRETRPLQAFPCVVVWEELELIGDVNLSVLIV